MDTPEWSRQIESARTTEEVVGLVRAYFESRPTDQLALLPPECAPPPAYNPQDIAECAYRLAAYHGHDDRYIRTVQRLAAVLSRATVRLAELARQKPDS